MSSSSASSKPPPHLLLHVDTSTATTTSNGSAASHGASASSTPSSSRSPRSSASGSSGGSGGGGGGQNQACAACKYQRRKCNPDCPLARYFPADQQRRFLNAHKLFGVSNIQKTLRRIDPEYGPEAMRALIYQSEARAADPVYGCVRIIKELERQLHIVHAEINAVHHQIAIYRQAASAGDPAIAADPAIGMLVAPAAGAPGQDNNNNVVMAMDALYGAGADQHVQEAGAGFAFVHHHDPQQQQQDFHHQALKDQADNAAQQHPLYDYFCYDGAAGDEATSSHDAAAAVQEYCYSDASVKNGSPMTTLGEQMEQHCQIEAAPFVDAFDDVKPQDLPVAMAHHGGHGDGIEQPEQKVAAAAVAKYNVDADQKMAEPAAAQCHLELGFSASF